MLEGAGFSEEQNFLFWFCGDGRSRFRGNSAGIVDHRSSGEERKQTEESMFHFARMHAGPANSSRRAHGFSIFCVSPGRRVVQREPATHEEQPSTSRLSHLFADRAACHVVD